MTQYSEMRIPTKCSRQDRCELKRHKRQGLSIRAISRLTGYDRKSIRKYLIQPEAVPEYAVRRAAHRATL
jgi:transposase